MNAQLGNDFVGDSLHAASDASVRPAVRLQGIAIVLDADPERPAARVGERGECLQAVVLPGFFPLLAFLFHRRRNAECCAHLCSFRQDCFIMAIHVPTPPGKGASHAKRGRLWHTRTKRQPSPAALPVRP